VVKILEEWGAYSPSRLISNDLENKILDKIIKPTLKGLSDLGSEYKGFLYAGLMIVENEPYLDRIQCSNG
jgi:phosphoribosylamine--glycine ligase